MGVLLLCLRPNKKFRRYLLNFLERSCSIFLQDPVRNLGPVIDAR
ncbi:hypothetical protein HMPREF1324_0195 [Rothia aeria F0474]|uniref:Uncharacterized protein n=1 Tax=Rothia aeria F0474 TaxID=1125724 RepID=I0USC0_9MICC|nr:hypothetical protein HMPREF1324_0195 [Rothia aeria F0474]